MLALVLLVVAGVVLSLTGITYGLIQLVSQEGFALLAGRYELGLGLAIAGVTVVLSALLYSGATGLIPFVDLLLFQVRISQIESPDASALRILHADLISRSITGKELLLGKSHG